MRRAASHLRSLKPRRSLSVGVVNRRKEPVTVRFESTLLGAKPVRVYEYDPQNVPFNRFCDLPDFTAVLAPDAAIYELKPESVTFFTTDYLEKTHTVSAFGPTVSAHTLTWEPVSDPNHCYYRIFADQKGGLCSVARKSDRLHHRLPSAA